MNRHSQLYSGADDCAWLRETALRGYSDVPPFHSFTIAGHEDCPLEIKLYAASEPLYTDQPVAEYELRTDPISNLGRYHRIRGQR